VSTENWLKKPSIYDKERIIGLIRNVLESHIKFKFYRQISHIPPNNQTFGTCIDEIEKSPVKFRDGDKAAIILVLRKLNSISCRPHHGGTLPDPKTYGMDVSKITDTELAKFVNKTFKLIDELL
jgi:hypothetical protein